MDFNEFKLYNVFVLIFITLQTNFMVIPHNPEYIHHTQGKISSSLLREMVFGLEDGMSRPLVLLLALLPPPIVSSRLYFPVL